VTEHFISCYYIWMFLKENVITFPCYKNGSMYNCIQHSRRYMLKSIYFFFIKYQSQLYTCDHVHTYVIILIRWTHIEFYQTMNRCCEVERHNKGINDILSLYTQQLNMRTYVCMFMDPSILRMSLQNNILYTTNILKSVSAQWLFLRVLSMYIL
jgi:hypothetical protein